MIYVRLIITKKIQTLISMQIYLSNVYNEILINLNTESIIFTIFFIFKLKTWT